MPAPAPRPKGLLKLLPVLFWIIASLSVSLAVPALAEGPSDPNSGYPAQVAGPDLLGILTQMEDEIKLLRRFIVYQASELRGNRSGDEGSAALDDRIRELLAENARLKDDMKAESQQRQALVREITGLRDKLDIAESKIRDFDESSIQLDSALVIMDTYEQALKRLNDRVGELEERLARAAGISPVMTAEGN